MKTGNVVHLPSRADIETAKASSRTLSKYAQADRVNVSLRGCNGECDDLVLPGPVLQILLDVLAEMAQGNAVTLLPHHQEVSTQEAARLLNVSRPFLIGLLEQDAIPFRKVGTHRRIKLQDVLAYKAHIDQRRGESLDELGGLSQDLDMGY